MQGGTPRTQSITNRTSDAIIPKYTFKNRYTVIFPTTKDRKNIPSVKADSYCYIYGSKTEKEVGLAIYG